MEQLLCKYPSEWELTAAKHPDDDDDDFDDDDDVEEDDEY